MRLNKKRVALSISILLVVGLGVGFLEEYLGVPSGVLILVLGLSAVGWGVASIDWFWHKK